MAYPASELDETRTATWQRSRERAAKREEYYQALRSLLEESTDPAYIPSRVELNERTGHRSSSTIYSVFSTSPLAAALGSSPFGTRLMDGSVVDHVVAEAKIWSYQNYRAGWLNGLSRLPRCPDRTVATSLLRTVAFWAASESALARTDGYAPPHIAVQDLCLVVDKGALTEPEAAVLLQRVVQTADGPLGILPSAVVDAVYDHLMGVAYERPDMIRQSLEDVREKLRDVLHLFERMPEAEVVRSLPPGISPEMLRRLTEGA